LWKYYYKEVNSIIFVVDSNDGERFYKNIKFRIEEAGKELHNFLSNPKLNKVKVLIFANKQDLTFSLNIKEIIEKLKLSNIKQNWIIKPCSIILEDNNLFEGMNWLINNVK
jgi:signal recognition particle receptor subunit beta